MPDHLQSRYTLEQLPVNREKSPHRIRGKTIPNAFTHASPLISGEIPRVSLTCVSTWSGLDTLAGSGVIPLGLDSLKAFDRLSACEPRFDLMPKGDFTFPILPAQIYLSSLPYP